MESNQTTQDEINEISNNFKQNFPDKGFTITDNYDASWFFGNFLIQKKDLTVIVTDKSTGQNITDDELKSQAFCWVYDSKLISDEMERAKQIHEKFNQQTKNQYHIFVGHNKKGSFKYAYSGQKAAAYFKGYEGDILIILF